MLPVMLFVEVLRQVLEILVLWVIRGLVNLFMFYLCVIGGLLIISTITGSRQIELLVADTLARPMVALSLVVLFSTVSSMRRCLK